MSKSSRIRRQAYGQKKPSLTVVLKRVLEGYPDGGQILKELIQNADDAGATEVKFLFDSRDNAFGTTSLINVGLSKFQGPALYVYNNGLFKEQDWIGIESIMQGSKKKDPVAAGRFGIGFNSVYHVTDLPSVVSDHYVAFLDPQETYFGTDETGRRYNMRDPLLQEYRDQFTPYESVLGCKISSGYFNGTLFRLPLRKWPSKISIKPYTAAKINGLFESFMEEAPIMLLFLKNIETISIYETSWKEREKRIFTVQIKEELRNAIRVGKQDFIDAATDFLTQPYEMIYETIVQVDKPDRSRDEFKFLVLNRVGHESTRLAELSSCLRMAPWAGVAASLDVPKEKSKTGNGRVFCYLPLPIESDWTTGLAVHVHGAFALTDNRRNLKWPGPESQSDEAAEWNLLLLRDVVSKAYASLIIALTKLNYPAKQMLSVADNIWPNIDRVQRQWKVILKPFFSVLMNEPVFWTSSLGGRWITLEEGVLDRLDCSPNNVREDVHDVVLKVLLQADVPVITLSQKAIKAVDEYAQQLIRRPQEITPSYVRSVLRGKMLHSPYGNNETKSRTLTRNTDIDALDIYCLNGNEGVNRKRSLPKTRSIDLETLSRKERLFLLEFVLMDCNFTELVGLPLLPLADGTFDEFRTDVQGYKPDHSVLVASRSHPRSLIPGNGSRFLDEKIDSSVLETLRSLAEEIEKSLEGAIQLVKLTPHLVPNLIHECMPDAWRNHCLVVPWDASDVTLPGDLWLRGLWSWLKTEFPRDLTPFEGIPLLPFIAGRTEKRRLIRLKKDHCVIQSSSYFASLPRTVASALQKAGCIVLSHLPPFCDHAALKDYIEPPTPSGVLKVLFTVMNEPGNDYLNSCSIEEKVAIRGFLSSLRNPSDDEVVALLMLPIFQTLDGKTFTSVQSGGPVPGTKLDVAPPRMHLPVNTKIQNANQVLSAADDDSYQLLRRLPVRILNTSEFLIDKVFPNIDGSGFYTRDQISDLMFWVIQRLPALSSDNKSFPDHLKSVRFVPVANGNLKAPYELYDPEDDIIQKLFEGEPNVFPTEEFSKAHALSLLRVFLGLRRSRSLEAKDCLLIAKQILQAPDQFAIRRAGALLQFLNDNSHLLDKEVLLEERASPSKKSPLGTVLSSLPWLPASKEPLEKYPSIMPWFGASRRLYSPKDMRDADMANVVGSTMPVLKGSLREKLKNAFGWSFPPPIRHVVDQLKETITAWKQQVRKLSEIELLKFQALLKDIYSHLCSEMVIAEAVWVLKEHSSLPWIWHGSGFAVPNCIALRSECLLDLKPYNYVISEDFVKYSALFKLCGVHETFSNSTAMDVLHQIQDWHQRDIRHPEEVERDLGLACDVLDFLTKDGVMLPPDVRKRVLIPIQTEDRRLTLEPCADVSFCDVEWLRVGSTDSDLTTAELMVHKSISIDTAQLLGTPPLSRKLAVTETLGFQLSGPYEPVTTRIKNILNDHSHDTDIFKELIQNAEDARATEVKFLLDLRNNERKKLLSPGLAETQGPALWVYNDACFSDNDFENISKLAAATKIGSKDKLGRFGLGFSTVYRITDLPSFISREFIAFFDPHTTYLGDLITDKSRPGIRLNLKDNHRVPSAFPDQFKPYEGIFGCTFDRKGEPFFYDGTLFRFPLRTMRQASESEICSQYYNENQMSHLISSFKENASTMILFLRYVTKLSFYQICEDQNPSHAMKIFQVDKQIVEQLAGSRIPQVEQDILSDNAQLQDRYFENDLHGSGISPQHLNDHSAHSARIVSIKSRAYSSSSSISFKVKPQDQTWFIRTCSGDGKSLQMANSEDGKLNGLLPKAEVAALLLNADKSKKRWKPEKVVGEAFSGLPLGVATGFPVHINGSFAVTTNRRNLWEDTGNGPSSQKPMEVLWNQYLLEDAASKAYTQLMEDMVSLHLQGKVVEFPFETVWPDPEKALSKIWKDFAYVVYQEMPTKRAALLKSQTEWVAVEDGVFLDAAVLRILESYQIMCRCGYNVVQLPKFITDAFHKSLPGIIAERTITMDKFVCNVFFPNIDNVPSNLRDPVTCYLLDEILTCHKYGMQLRETKCIPTSPAGDQLSRPGELIDPSGVAGGLFLEEENVFPRGACFVKMERLVALRKLGMVDNLLTWERICERTEFIAALVSNDSGKATLLSRNLIKYMNENMNRISPPSATQRKRISEARFLPVMSKPEEYYLPWKGDMGTETRFLSARELFRDEWIYLLGSVKPILDESSETGCGRLTKDVAKLLGICGRPSTVNDVLLQLYSAIQGLVENDAASRECTRKVCSFVYQFLQDRINTSDFQIVQDSLDRKPWIFVATKFVTSSQVAFSCRNQGVPFLCCISEDFTLKFKDLFKALGVRESFSAQDIADALLRLKERKQGQPLTRQELRTVKYFLEEIVLMNDKALNSYCGELPLPDTNLVLRPASGLTINDAPWMYKEHSTNCLHGDISPIMAYKLGAHTIREQTLDKYSHCFGRPFGQSERLTDRIKNVLKSYPCDSGVFQEIIQNADDAGATEIHFINDPRQHETTRVLSEQWKDLQGPALCVFNDCAFTEEDIEGIQRLGIGGKMNNPEKTGKYGIGFNAVYHVTDCPSFITNGELLCVLDPHARYAPNATLEFPGRRFDPLDEQFWNDFADVRSGYLEEFFDLKSSTMFRLPIRTELQAKESKLSSKTLTSSDIDQLLAILKSELHEILLFLKSVKKISISRIENNRLHRGYEATSTISSDDVRKIHVLNEEVGRCKELETKAIPWFSITHTTTIQDTLGRKEEWVIQQCLGSRLYGEKPVIPNGRKIGLLPRAAVAVRLASNGTPARRRRSINTPPLDNQHNKTYRAFCFLPLPVETGLPVHINGQFALDSSRRNLWKDHNSQGQRTQWNDFIKTYVLAPAYAELIACAREYIPGISAGDQWYFNDNNDVTSGLQWYHNIFPDPDSTHSEWKTIATTVYRLVATSNQAVLPIIREEPSLSSIAPSPRRFSNYDNKSLVQCSWVPPCSENDDQQALFTELSSPDLECFLRTIRLPIVHAPPKLYSKFRDTGVMVKTVNPDIVMTYLEKKKKAVDLLPCSIDKTVFKNLTNLKRLLQFCMEDENFLQRLNGLPLLLTEDGMMREFDSKNPVFLTPYSSLLPSQPDLFVNKDMIPLFSKFPASDTWKSGVFKRFDTDSIEPFLIQVFPSRWFACDRHMSWEPSQTSIPSVEWLTTLWELILMTYNDRQSSFESDEDASETLRPFEDWPIIPTSRGTLVPVSLGKTVLDLNPRVHDVERITRILYKLGGSQLDFSVLIGLNKDVARQLVSPCLAKPYSRQDVISVLHYLSKEDEFQCELGKGEIVSLFRFLQEDIATVYSNYSLLKKLPFYKKMTGRLVSLDSFAFSYVVDLPQCVPLITIEDRIEEESCVLLEAITEIEPFYKAMNINCLSQVEVFVKYILPNLHAMPSSGIQTVLLYIRDTLLVTLKSASDRTLLFDALRENNIIPGSDKSLSPVSKFYDPENAVFQDMLHSTDFPPEEYRLSTWLPFLRDIGLKHTVTQQQFLDFAESLASDAETRFMDPLIRKKSQSLVKCLFQQDDLHDPSFMHIVSSIKFVAADCASDELRNLHPQCGCDSKDDVPPFTEFHGALPSEQQKLAWTSINLLPGWATPSTVEKRLLEDLGVALLPPTDKVINHVNVLSKAHSGNVHKDTPKDQRELLHDVIYEAFSFLKRECHCPSAVLSGKCSKSCLAIGSTLMKTPCIPVDEGRVLVEGSQLAFETTTELPPYFYKVPREYGHFEHLLKRLGANEKPTPTQFADILGRLKEVCEDKHMEPNEKKVAREATHGFFTTLSVLVKEKSKDAASRCLSLLNDLYLPSKEGFLKHSYELIFHDCPSFERRARDFAGDFVDISREGELTADRLSYLLSLLPLRLRAKTIQNLLKEEIHPSCRDKRCIADSPVSSDPCTFVTRYRNILLSPKLVNGILRVIRHQRQTPNLPQEVKDRVQVFCSSLRVTCMSCLDTHLIHLESGNPLQHSNETQDCFLEEQNDHWELFIRHGTDENPLNIQLCFQVNRLIGNQIDKEIYLQAMLACRVPDEILPALDRCGVAQDLMGSEARTTEPVLGSEIPVTYHHLLRQDIEYFFRQGEIVGYEKERQTQDGRIDDSEPLYVYAKVVRKVPNRKRSMESTKFDFQAKYRIDIGEPRLAEVSVLDLYKFDRSGKESTSVPVELSNSLEITLFTGDPKESKERLVSRNERLEKAKQEIKDTLWEAWKLPEKERRKVVKRLFLRWHPDKNIGCDITHEMMQFLLNEIERMEKLFPSTWRDNFRDVKRNGTSDAANGFHECFNQWNQRARQERQTYDTFKSQTHQGGQNRKRSTNPQRNEAKRWMKQGKEDLIAAKHLQAQETMFPALVCFLCQQATEKVLKSALYAACGIAESQLETHDVLNLAYEITELDGSPVDIPLLAAKLKNYYEQTRYPHFHRGDAIPSEAFSPEQANEALETSEAILEKITEFVDQHFDNMSSD